MNTWINNERLKEVGGLVLGDKKKVYIKNLWRILSYGKDFGKEFLDIL